MVHDTWKELSKHLEDYGNRIRQKHFKALFLILQAFTKHETAEERGRVGFSLARWGEGVRGRRLGERTDKS